MMLSSPLVKAVFHLSWLLAVLCFLNSSASAQTCMQPPTGLVSWWPAEGNAQDIIGPNAGTLQGGTTFAPGVVGQAFSFDSIDDFVHGNTTTGFPLGSSPRTITAWIKAVSVGPLDSIIFHYGVGNGDFPPTNFHLFMTSDGQGGIGNGFGYGIAVGTTFLGDDQFHFLAGVYEGTATNIARIYVDGVEEGSAVIMTPGTLSGAFTIGQELPEAHQLPFDGLIDEVDIYNRALSTEEIAAIFNAGSAGKCKETEVQEVTIDIKPGSSPNSINPKSRGVIPVAILTTDTFDATTVDALSVRFGPKGAKEAHNKGHIEDVNQDGEPDLLLHFRTQATGIQCGQTSASLTGETFDGEPLQGSDAIHTVGCKK